MRATTGTSGRAGGAGRAGRVAVALASAIGQTAAACTDDRRRAPADSVAAGPPPVAVDTICWLGPAQVSAAGVGTVRLGMAAEELRVRCGGRDTALVLGEGLTERAVVVHVGRATAVALTSDRDLVERVLVPVRGPTTGGGVGVGSRLASVRARHGRLCGFVGEGRIVVMAAGLPGVSFVTDADYATFAADSAALRAADFPRATRVTDLLVHGGPSACATS